MPHNALRNLRVADLELFVTAARLKNIALVLDNAPWEGVTVTEVGKGCFQLYSSKKKIQRQIALLLLALKGFCLVANEA